MVIRGAEFGLFKGPEAFLGEREWNRVGLGAASEPWYAVLLGEDGAGGAPEIGPRSFERAANFPSGGLSAPCGVLGYAD